ncbi:MAG: glycine cleavage system protein GcvH [Gemmatimonadetes bacterium]|nr:glycine cleavage system protein GcvH [Gemmatimonadota bacterium]MBI2537976.1 glycine cleavage system protein GcvH [Gemmatimonadota bacterium]MBI3081842.1 glycine cleavage system protein GcvH [Gemmatimonadota bacterium]
MSKIPDHLHYTEEHEYVKPTDEAGIVQVGITDYAQGELGDVVYVDLPAVETKVGRMEVFGTIEAVKAVSELFCPVAGEVVEVNQALEGDPSLVNQDPYGEGWMIKLRVKNAAELDRLLTASDYAQHIGE